MSVKKKILFGHSYFGRGGAESAAMLAIESLKNDYTIHLITRGGWNLEELNTLSGTSILENEIILVKFPFRRLSGTNKFFGLLWDSYFNRLCRRLAPGYDYRITASSTINWGMPAIHFLTDIVWNRELNLKFNTEIRKRTSLYKAYNFLADQIKGKTSWEPQKNDFFIANSLWTSAISAPYTSIPPGVIYPAVAANFRDVLWSTRKNEFVLMGRISPEKKIEDAITIIEKVRKQGYNIGLTIFGQFDRSEYSNTIKELIKDKIWINAPGPIYGNEKSTILPTFKYGINTCQREAFGISTAEMMKAGIIPFVPVIGAQFEIINHDDLVFENLQDAVIKIVNVLNSEIQQQNLIDHLNKQMLKFSAEEFKCRILGLLSNIGNE